MTIDRQADRVLPLDASIESKPREGRSEIVVEFETQPEERWCLELAMLEMGLADTLGLESTGPGEHSLVLVAEEPASSVEGWELSGSSPWEIPVPQNYIEAVLRYFLEYYRDGRAPTDHIHLEIAENFELTFKVPDVQPPMPYEEAKKRLDED